MNAYGTHVLSKSIVHIPENMREFILREILEDFHNISCDVNGLTTMKKLV